MNTKITALVLTGIFLIACNEEKRVKNSETSATSYKNKGHELVSKMVEKVGNYKMLRKKKDVVYTYSYQTPDGKIDISTEKYIFDGELSYGSYLRHERTLSDLKGSIEQGYDGKEFWIKHNGTVLNDSRALKRTAFNRPTNFYWFTMFQKLLDPGLEYEYLGEETINETQYDIVRVTFISTDQKPTDIYQLYINKITLLVDQFLFTVADFGVLETPNLMKLAYTEVDGMLFPTKRAYKKSTWKASVSDAPWIKVNWTDIKFNNDLNRNNFKE